MATSCSRLPAPRRVITALSAAGALALALTACGPTTGPTSMPGMGHDTKSPMSTRTPPPSSGDMPDMGHAAAGSGLSDIRDGYRLTSTDATLAAGAPAGYRFTAIGPDTTPVTEFAVDQTKRMHFYAIRSDLTGFQHTHPTMAADGTWTAHLAALAPGSWRMFASFTPEDVNGRGTDLVLSRAVTVPGDATTTPLPAPAATTTVDGYTVTLDGTSMAGMTRPLTVTVSTQGTPVTDLQPYLGTYAHLTAFHEGDSAFAHLHPTTTATGNHGGPTLTFHAELPTPGDWRLFLQFQTGGRLHTAALTLNVG